MLLTRFLLSLSAMTVSIPLSPGRSNVGSPRSPSLTAVLCVCCSLYSFLITAVVDFECRVLLSRLQPSWMSPSGLVSSSSTDLSPYGPPRNCCKYWAVAITVTVYILFF
ncbi:hypothetical protein AMECASPLE_036447 [Ameca splendens]|uniref:Secreted peptide n=1 Tax=Ameca splendens TaxID=208324 RepID=A0ABV0XKP2_9TELE